MPESEFINEEAKAFSAEINALYVMLDRLAGRFPEGTMDEDVRNAMTDALEGLSAAHEAYLVLATIGDD